MQSPIYIYIKNDTSIFFYPLPFSVFSYEFSIFMMEALYKGMMKAFRNDIFEILF